MFWTKNTHMKLIFDVSINQTLLYYFKVLKNLSYIDLFQLNLSSKIYIKSKEKIFLIVNQYHSRQYLF